MYNSKPIQSFIDKVTKEAEEAAQKVFDKHQDKLIELIKNQLHKEDKLWIGMGTAYITRGKNDVDANREFINSISQTQYWKLEAGFSLPDITK